MPAEIGRDELRKLTGQGLSWSRYCPSGTMSGHTCPARSITRSRSWMPEPGSWTGPGRSSSTATTGI